MRFALFLFGFFALSATQVATCEILSATDKIVEKFMALDIDESETVSFEEYKTMVMQRLDDRFQAMDANEDGEASAEEYKAFWIKKKAEYYRPRR